MAIGTYSGTRTSALGMLFLPIVGVMIVGLLRLVMLGGGMVAETTYTTHQTIARVNALNITKTTATEHVGAAQAWENYRNGVCENKRVYYHPVRGYLMVSCQISGTDQCVQLIFQVTTYSPDGLVSMSPGMHIHGQIHSCGYINTYQAGKGYTPWEQVAADIHDVITSVFGEP